MTLTHIALPVGVGFRAVKFGLVGRTQKFSSPFTGNSQINALGGSYWRASYEAAPTKGANAGDWRAFLAQLGGRANAFYGHDPSFGDYRGIDAFSTAETIYFDSTVVTFDSNAYTMDEWAGPSAAGAPFVSGAGQTGSTLDTSGWTPGLVLYAGEYVAFPFTDPNGVALRALHMITATVTTGGGGEVALPLVPAVRIAPADGALLVTDKPSCSMRLKADDGGGWDTDAARIHRISFEAEQVLTSEKTA